MITIPELPLPRLSRDRFISFHAYTDETLFAERDTRIAFTERWGGLSEGPFASLNLGMNTSDLQSITHENRDLLMRAFEAAEVPCLVPRQVHGRRVCRVREDDPSPLKTLNDLNAEGVDAILVEPSQVAALLCFADCVPIIIVSPSGRFAVIHAGWRGVMQEIACESLTQLQACDMEAGSSFEADQYNVYIGPYIHKECFEVDSDVHESFVKCFGTSCASGADHIDLGYAVRKSLYRVGVNEARVADVGACTVCNNESFFSYRAQEGVCGRHGAFALRK